MDWNISVAAGIHSWISSFVGLFAILYFSLYIGGCGQCMCQAQLLYKKDFTSEISIDSMAALYHPTVGKSTAFARFMVFASILFAYCMVL